MENSQAVHRCMTAEVAQRRSVMELRERGLEAEAMQLEMKRMQQQVSCTFILGVVGGEREKDISGT